MHPSILLFMTPPDDWSSSWSADDDDAPWSPERERGDASGDPPALQALLNPLQLTQRAIAHERAEGELTAVATYLADGGEEARPIGIQGVPAPFARALLASTLFASPTPLLATAWVREAGIEVILQALVPAASLHELERSLRAEDEPWLAAAAESPAGAEDAPFGEEEVEPVVAFPIGKLWRYSANFVAGGEVQQELTDLLLRVLSGEGTDAKTKEVENFLRDSGLGF